MAFTQRLPEKIKSEDDDKELEIFNKATHCFVVLDTKSGYQHELYSYRHDFWGSANDLVTKLRPDKAFFGRGETEPTLFVQRASNRGDHKPEGQIWRRMLGVWRNIGRIQFDWKCRPQIFNNEDTRVIGINAYVIFSANVDGMANAVHCIEKDIVSGEGEFALARWEYASHTTYIVLQIPKAFEITRETGYII